MVDVAPFRALRFDPGKKTKDISEFICPPYDVISPSDKEELKAKSNYNIVKIELPDGTDEEKYSGAARLLDAWKNESVLGSDRNPSFYLLETTYRIDDPFAPRKIQRRYGVLAGLRLETPGKGDVRPHEKTLPKAKEDRLNLLKSVRTNVSPIFGLFFDPEKNWDAWVKKATGKPFLVKGKENSKLSHKLWKVDEGPLIKTLRNILDGKPLYIADGHHRYEVAWAYQEFRLEEDPKADLHSGWRRVMTYLCPIEEAGLLMLPTHRLVKSGLSFKDWCNHLKSIFEIRKVASMKSLIGTLAASKKRRSLGWAAREGSFLLELKDDVSLGRCLSQRHESLRALDVVLLHDVVLGEASGHSFLKEREIIFTRDIKEIQKKVKASPSWTAFILSSPGVTAMARVAESGQVMPPKTTYFYPKVPTGFAVMPLDQVIK